MLTKCACKYSDVCPAYEKCDERCHSDIFCRGTEECIPLLLEAYHREKGTPWDDIKHIYDEYWECRQTRKQKEKDTKANQNGR